MRNLILTITLILVSFSFCLAQDENGDNVTLDVARINKDWETIKSDFLIKLQNDKPNNFRKGCFDSSSTQRVVDFVKFKDNLMKLPFNGSFDIFLDKCTWGTWMTFEPTIKAYKSVATDYIAKMKNEYKMDKSPISNDNTCNNNSKIDDILSTLSVLKHEMSDLKNDIYPLYYWLMLILSPLLCLVFFYLYLKEKFTGKEPNDNKASDVTKVMQKNNLSDEIKRLEKVNKDLLEQLDDTHKDIADLRDRNKKLYSDNQTLVKTYKSKNDNCLLKEKDSEIARLKRQVSDLQTQLNSNSQHSAELLPANNDYKYLRQFNNGYFNIVQDNYDGQSQYRMFNIKDNATANFEFYGNESVLLKNWSSMLAPICEFDGDPTRATHVENIKSKPGILTFDNAIGRWKVTNKAHVKLS